MRRIAIMLTTLFGFIFCRAQIILPNKVGQDKMLERFLSYVSIESQSIDDTSMATFPISEGQKDIAQYIYKEVKGLGGKDVKVTLSKDFYIYIDIPSNIQKDVLSVLFMALYMDESTWLPYGDSEVARSGMLLKKRN